MLTALLVALLMIAAFTVNRTVVQPARERSATDHAERRRQLQLVRRRQAHLASRLGDARPSTRPTWPIPATTSVRDAAARRSDLAA